VLCRLRELPRPGDQFSRIRFANRAAFRYRELNLAAELASPVAVDRSHNAGGHSGRNPRPD
ncbi:MAG: hypothetical protein QGG36_03285, partial [Pirellulaceae bacterium]|nr:hypothetical protein [Pirellulaceae bacterium]